MNKIFLAGRLTKDPECKMVTDKMLTKFSLAVDRTPTKDGKKEADFFNCVVWGKTAETIGNYVTKGQKIIVEGRIQNRSWEKDGQKHTITEVWVDRFEFCDKPNKKAEEKQNFGTAAPEGEPVPF